jgi:ParB-like chromosome segregation protein Spo0J
MANDNNKEPEILERATSAETRRTRVRLSDLTFDTDRYCHRAEEALKEENLEDLLKSLTLEGLQVPVEYFSAPGGRKVVTKGHRRVTACRILAARNTPGFTEDMEVEAIEVLGATPQDLLVRSVADNEVRLNLDRVGRIKVAKKLYDAGVQLERAARALGVSPKTYERDLLIAQHGWMFQHVMDDSIAPTPAYVLLAKAVEVERARELKEDLDAWVAGQKQKIRERERRLKAQQNKELRPADRMVKKYLTNHLVAHWLELLSKRRRFDEDAQWNFAAGIEEETDRLRISSLSLDLTKASSDQLGLVASKLSRLTKQLRPYLQKRHEEEKRRAQGDVVANSPFDLDFLREMGLDDLANQMEARLRVLAEADGEEDPGHAEPEPRAERDLTDGISLPDGGPGASNGKASDAAGEAADAAGGNEASEDGK